RVRLDEDRPRPFDDLRNHRIIDLVAPLRRDDFLGKRNRIRARLLLSRRSRRHRRKDEGEKSGANGPGIGDHGESPLRSVDYCGRSTTRTPATPAITTVLASPTNKPCSTTPAMAASRSPRPLGSGIRPSEASRIQCPPSVTKAWPSLSRRSRSGPATPMSAVTASTARPPAPTPHAITP